MIAKRKCLEPLFEILVLLALKLPDCLTEGSNPAKASNFVAELNRVISPISLICLVSKIKTQLTKNNKIMAFATLEDRFGSMEAVIFPNVYEKFALFLNEGNVVVARGSLNFKENEEPKLICDTLEKARTDNECSEKFINKENVIQNIKKQPTKPAALYLRIDDLNTDLFYKAKRILEIFEGTTPVIFYLTNTSKLKKAPASLWVTLNDVMIKELKYQLGENNVATK